MKHVKKIILLFMVISIIPIEVSAEVTNQKEEYHNLIEGTELEAYWDYLGDEYQDALPELSKESLWNMIKGGRRSYTSVMVERISSVFFI
ncbi:hypothetical protein JCM21714_183 [Gracilibacillus boraciitolerans JCM 21714]|uniref:Uncharacterized protein n=1 Tax=Gracilibacillus boraciitolerans JCM 21714 TaxID=1298598 RepID=W4VEQ5_9BACI|nr:hypothetical protein [Gracilibacillus boraciitolerans]GAE91239.1 hypothetical protein JCM21714_183 [Gracilibacillus boraciitolerans JCM 21714]